MKALLNHLELMEPTTTMTKLRLVVEFEHIPDMDDYDYPTPEEAIAADIESWKSEGTIALTDLLYFIAENNPQIISLEQIPNT